MRILSLSVLRSRSVLPLMFWLWRSVAFVSAFSASPASPHRPVRPTRDSTSVAFTTPVAATHGYHGSTVTTRLSAISIQDIPSSMTMADLNDSLSSVASPAVLLAVALVVGVTANGWIQRLLQGDQGLSSFLSDGAGFNKSRFKPLRGDEDRAVQTDPLPWLQLPKLDFVEVAGQEQRSNVNAVPNDPSSPDEVIVKLEGMRQKLGEQLANGNMTEAKTTRIQMEALMKESGIQYLGNNR